MKEKDSLELLYRLLLDANETALRRGDAYGLCDCIDNAGNPYPSAVIAGVIKHATEFVAQVDGVPMWQDKTKPLCCNHGYWRFATAFEFCPDCHQPLSPA